jgi:hypothetical protein
LETIAGGPDATLAPIVVIGILINGLKSHNCGSRSSTVAAPARENDGGNAWEGQVESGRPNERDDSGSLKMQMMGMARMHAPKRKT